MILTDNAGRFEMEWKALFELKTLVVLSKALPLEDSILPSPWGGLGAYLDCTDSITCSISSVENQDFFNDPEFRMSSPTPVNRLWISSLTSVTGTFTFCMVAALSPCDCNTSSFKS
jgi:hypothetical protein